MNGNVDFRKGRGECKVRFLLSSARKTQNRLRERERESVCVKEKERELSREHVRSLFVHATFSGKILQA